ncbi:ATP-binding protein [Spirosoma gilvum]
MERTLFPGTLDSLDGIRQVVKENAEQAGLSKKAAYNLMLAIDEIATNIIVHGYEENGMTGPIDLLTEQADGHLTVILEDEAPQFDPLQRDKLTDEFLSKPLEERPIGGMGIHLAIKAVDTYQYEWGNQRNRNVFTMKVEPK